MGANTVSRASPRSQSPLDSGFKKKKEKRNVATPVTPIRRLQNGDAREKHVVTQIDDVTLLKDMEVSEPQKKNITFIHEYKLLPPIQGVFAMGSPRTPPTLNQTKPTKRCATDCYGNGE